MTLYATLAQAKIQMQANATNGVEQAERRLLDNIRIASRRVDALLSPLAKREMFAPHIATRTLRVSGYDVNTYDGTLRLNESLLAFTSATLGTTALTDVEAWPTDVTPIEYLRLTGCCGASWYSDPACAANGGPLTVAVAGTWGIHRDYANAWQSVDTLQAAIISTTATTFTVASAAGNDTFGIAPRLSPGNLVRIDSEMMEVVTVATNTITVRRGVNGSTAATHLNGAAVETFLVEEPVRYAVARQAGLMTARYGAYTTVEVSGAGTEVRYPADLLTELKGVLAEYQYGS